MMRNPRRLAFSLLVGLPVGLLAAGCGGGSGTGGGLGSSIQTAHIGPVSVSFTGHPQLFTSSSSGHVPAVGQAGASYSKLSMNPAPDLSSTYLAFTRFDSQQTFEIYTLPAVQAGGAKILVHTSHCDFPSISQSGVIAFVAYTSGAYQLDTIASDGSNQKTVASLGTTNTITAISTNGALIAYVGSDGNVYTEPIAGGTPTKITTLGNADRTGVFWSPRMGHSSRVC